MSESDIGFKIAIEEAEKGAAEGGVPIGGKSVDFVSCRQGLITFQHVLFPRMVRYLDKAIT